MANSHGCGQRCRVESALDSPVILICVLNLFYDDRISLGHRPNSQIHLKMIKFNYLKP